MITKESKPAISAKSGNAVLVIIRTTSFGWGSVEHGVSEMQFLPVDIGILRNFLYLS
jgi:hypothetical protein